MLLPPYGWPLLGFFMLDSGRHKALRKTDALGISFDISTMGDNICIFPYSCFVTRHQGPVVQS